jgi:hypothetical protein
MFKFLSENFALVSAAITAVTACIVMTFLFAYLSVFDWALIWIIEYTDIIKFSLIGVAIVSSLWFFLFYISSKAYNWMILGEKYPRLLIAAVVILVVWLAVSLCVDFVSSASAIQYHIFLALSLIYLVSVILYAIDTYKHREDISLLRLRVINGLMILIVMVPIFGHTCGLGVRDAPGMKHDVTVQEQNNWRHTLEDATIILVTSHHTIIRVGSKIVTLPSNDIVRIEARPMNP